MKIKIKRRRIKNEEKRMKTKYIDMKCPNCKKKMFRLEGSLADWSCNKCGKLFLGGTMVEKELGEMK